MIKPLDFHIEGDKCSNNLLVFLQGWPDNHRLWEWIDWKKELMDNKIVFIDFPNTSSSKADLKWG